MLKNILCLAAGAGIGFVVANQIYTKKFNAEIGRETEKAWGFWKKYFEDQQEGDAEPSDEGDEAEPLFELKGESTPDAVVQAMTNYAGITKSEAPESTPPIVKTAEAPKIITFAEYETTETEFEKRVVTYYSGDKKVTDEFDTAMTDERVGKCLGWGNIRKMAETNQNPIYIRCAKFNQDFEVNMHAGKYAVIVEGEDDTEDSILP